MTSPAAPDLVPFITLIALTFGFMISVLVFSTGSISGGATGLAAATGRGAHPSHSSPFPLLPPHQGTSTPP